MKETSWLEILFWVMMVILFIMILTRIFGHSVTDVQIFLTATMIILTIMGYIVKMNREIGEIKIHMINSFKKVRNDINTLSTKK